MEYHTYLDHVDCVEIEYQGPQSKRVPATESAEGSWSADAIDNLELLVTTFREVFKPLLTDANLSPIIEKEGFTRVEPTTGQSNPVDMEYTDQYGRNVNFYKPASATTRQNKSRKDP